ncbi:MAG: zinc-dependent metalloprotease [Chloroflexi bacterium]|nr:zinc-dependent metalloprotease [Chloroflexota bacterium]
MVWRRAGWIALAGAIAYRAAAEWRSHGEPPQAISWDRARDLARLMAPAGQVDPAADYAGAVRTSQAEITALTGWTVERDLGAVAVPLDRHTWLNRLLPRMRAMTADLEGHYRQVVAMSPQTWLARDVAAEAMAAPIGMLLGGLANLVLGQYEVELLAAPQSETDVLFIDPNISRVMTQFNLPGHQFRQFIALHETAHGFQFEVFPWFRADLAGAVRAILARVLDQAAHQSGLSWDFVQAAIGGPRGDPELRRQLDHIQARMALAEGTSNFLMHRIGARILPDYADIAAISERRTRSVSRQILGLLGMARKFEQYRLGEQFVKAVVDRRGLAALSLAWRSAETAPTLDEVAEPDRWLDRMGD